MSFHHIGERALERKSAPIFGPKVPQRLPEEPLRLRDARRVNPNGVSCWAARAYSDHPTDHVDFKTEFVVNNIYLNTAISTQAAADTHIRATQGNFASANSGYQGHLDRGSDALAHIIADLYVSIETVLASTSADVQALILMAHHVTPAKGRASEFGPWIKVATGREKPNGKLRKAANGVLYPEWDANRSFEKYFHVMEDMRENEVVSDHADYIKRAGGAMAIVEKRQKRLKEAAAAGEKETLEEKRHLLLSEGPAVPFELKFELPKDAGDYFTIVCRRAADGNPVMLGVVRADADKDFTALAVAQFDALKKAKDERLADEAKQAAATEAAKRATEETERDFMRVVLSPEKLAVMKAEAERRYKAGELTEGDAA